MHNTDQQLENLERLTVDIEFAQIELQVVAGLKTGNEALKGINELLNIEDIEKIMDETRDGAEKQAEINSILSGVTTEEDEIEILRELDELIDREEQAELPSVPVSADDEEMDIEESLPDVPIEDPQKRAPETVKEKKREAVLAE